jgi:hypothetical protein
LGKLAAPIIVMAFSMLALGPAIAGTKERTLTISVWGLEPDRCRVKFEGAEYIIPDADDELRSALIASRKRANGLQVISDMTTPWRCVGAVMTYGGRAKFKKIGFIAEPPSHEWGVEPLW